MSAACVSISSATDGPVSYDPDHRFDRSMDRATRAQARDHHERQSRMRRLSLWVREHVASWTELAGSCQGARGGVREREREMDRCPYCARRAVSGGACHVPALSSLRRRPHSSGPRRLSSQKPRGLCPSPMARARHACRDVEWTTHVRRVSCRVCGVHRVGVGFPGCRDLLRFYTKLC